MHQNNFGFLRLIFSYLVIISHTPELLYGNRIYEPLYYLFGTISLGELAVSGFFLISGYLMNQSYKASNTALIYLGKRILRIYLGFILAFLLSVFVFAPISSGFEIITNQTAFDFFKNFVRMILLIQPWVDDVFQNNYFSQLNGAMWTIQLEFLCYLLVPIFSIKVFNVKLNQWMFLFMVIVLGAAIIHSDSIKGLRLITAFLAGSIFYDFKNYLKHSVWMFLILGLFLISLNNKYLADFALIVLGGWLLFVFAIRFNNKKLQNVGSKSDLSYGVYLYGWPTQSLLIQFFPNSSAITISLLTISIVSILAYLSWWFVEKPSLLHKAKLQR